MLPSCQPPSPDKSVQWTGVGGTKIAADIVLDRAAPATTAESLKVLIVDDQRAMRSILRQLLHSLGIRHVVEATNGKEALEVLTQIDGWQIDLVISDLHMGTMDGIQFCNTVRRTEALRLRHLPIMMLTSEHDELLLEVIRQVGASDIAFKPISAPELAKRLARLVGVRLW